MIGSTVASHYNSCKGKTLSHKGFMGRCPTSHFGDTTLTLVPLAAKRQMSTTISVLILFVATLVGATPAIAQIPAGTVMVSTGNGRVTEYTQNGTFLAQLDTTTGARETTGSTFDSAGNFYVTTFSGQQVTKFDPSGTLIGPFGSGYSADPESILFDGVGNVYVGQADGTHEILKFDPSGNPLATFSPATEDRGTDWIDLAADQCTMYYTSEGVEIKRFDVCTNTQLTDFNVATLPGSTAYAHRIRPNGEVLVADTELVVRLNSAGNQIKTYTIPGATSLFALNLDSDGASFWTADIGADGGVFKVDIASGTILQQWNATGAPNFVDVAGLSIKGEIVVAVPTPTLTSATTTTPTPSPTLTPTNTATPTQTPTPTFIPLGHPCTDSQQCASGGVCNGRICVAPAPAASGPGLFVLGVLLAGVGVYFAGRRVTADHTP